MVVEKLNTLSYIFGEIKEVNTKQQKDVKKLVSFLDKLLGKEEENKK